MSQYEPKYDLKINIGHCNVYFMLQWFCLISWRLFDVRTSLFGIMSQYDPTFDLKINIGYCDLYFMDQWLCNTSWRLFDVWTSYFGIVGQYDPTFGLNINVGLCDLYVMVQWFCLIFPRLCDARFCLLFPRLFDAWVSYFQVMRQCDPNFDIKVYMSKWPIFHVIVIFVHIRFSDFALYLEDNLMYEHHKLRLWISFMRRLTSK